MDSIPTDKTTPSPKRLRRCRKGWAKFVESQAKTDSGKANIDVGCQLRKLRIQRDLTIRALAELSGLNVNTLSLIENGKTSPSVGTLQILANALDVPITAFFESSEPKVQISYQKAGQRPQAAFAHGTMEELGTGFPLKQGQFFLVTLEPKANSGSNPVVHTGHEFVFCLEGQITYVIEDRNFILDPGDCLLFEAHLPHTWKNTSEVTSRSLLIMCPTDERDHPTERHFRPEV